MFKIGFDNEKYIQTQSGHIHERIAQFGGKLYLEFGGKLFDDYHAARVLPGFAPDSKIRMLVQLAAEAEVVIVINAADIEKNKVRGDLGITYDQDVLRLIDAFRGFGLYVGSVVLTRYDSSQAVETFKKKLEANTLPIDSMLLKDFIYLPYIFFLILSNAFLSKPSFFILFTSLKIASLTL